MESKLKSGKKCLFVCLIFVILSGCNIQKNKSQVFISLEEAIEKSETIIEANVSVKNQIKVEKRQNIIGNMQIQKLKDPDNILLSNSEHNYILFIKNHTLSKAFLIDENKYAISLSPGETFNFEIKEIDNKNNKLIEQISNEKGIEESNFHIIYKNDLIDYIKEE